MDLLWLYVPQAAADMVGSEHGRGDTMCLPVQLATEAFQSHLCKAPGAHPWLGFCPVSAVLNRS